VGPKANCRLEPHQSYVAAFAPPGSDSIASPMEKVPCNGPLGRNRKVLVLMLGGFLTRIVAPPWTEYRIRRNPVWLRWGNAYQAGQAARPLPGLSTLIRLNESHQDVLFRVMLLRKYAAVSRPSQGRPAMSVTRIPSTHHVVARIATIAAAPSAEVYG